MDGDHGKEARTVAVQFNGTAAEYFRIWIVNLALTIATLGVYSAWATVRKLRYFYGQTVIDGGRFDFHADPKAILIGRVIALGFLAAYYFSGYLSPALPALVLLGIIAMVPWLIVRSRVFRLRNTSYRNVRLNFRPDYGGAFKSLYGGALITIFTLGFGTPVAIYWKNRFMVNNSGFGQTFFRLSANVGQFYSIFWKTAGLGILGYIAFVILLAVFAGTALPTEEQLDPEADVEFGLFPALVVLSGFLIYGAVYVYSQVRHRNLVWNTSDIAGTSFESTLSVRDMLWIYFSNTIAIVATFGLAIPWAQIRLARYRAERLKVGLASDWSEFVAVQKEAGSAAGDAIGDAFDVGVDIGI